MSDEWNKPAEFRLLPSDAYMTLALEKDLPVQACAFFAEGGDFLDPGLRDVFEDPREQEAKWYPNSAKTTMLVACLHVCKDLLAIGKGIDAQAPWADRRQVAHFATPLVSLCDKAKELYAALGREQAVRASWPQADHDLYIQTGRQLKKHRESPLRVLRNTSTAHVRDEILHSTASPISVTPQQILPPMKDSLVFLILALNYERIYTWVRRPADADTDEAEIMTEYPMAIRVKLNADRSIKEVARRSTIATDPREYAREIILRSIELHNRLAFAASPMHERIKCVVKE